MRRTSVRTGRNFSPARKVRSMTLPSEARRSLVRTNAPPLPGLTCWNSTILKTVPSTSMWLPLRNWLVEIMFGGQCRTGHPGQPVGEVGEGQPAPAVPQPDQREDQERQVDELVGLPAQRRPEAEGSLSAVENVAQRARGAHHALDGGAERPGERSAPDVLGLER